MDDDGIGALALVVNTTLILLNEEIPDFKQRLLDLLSKAQPRAVSPHLSKGMPKDFWTSPNKWCSVYPTRDPPRQIRTLPNVRRRLERKALPHARRRLCKRPAARNYQVPSCRPSLQPPFLLSSVAFRFPLLCPRFTKGKFRNVKLAQ